MSNEIGTYYVLHDTTGTTLAYEPVGIIIGTREAANELSRIKSIDMGVCRVVTEDTWFDIEAQQIRHRQRFPFGSL